MSQHRYAYKVQSVLRVLDGDTYDVQIALGFGMSATMRFRLFGVDTPEIFGAKASAEGKAAHTFAQEWFAAHEGHVSVETYKGAQATVGIGDGVYGRWLGDFYDRETAERLAEALVGAGLARVM